LKFGFEEQKAAKGGIMMGGLDNNDEETANESSFL